MGRTVTTSKGVAEVHTQETTRPVVINQHTTKVTPRCLRHRPAPTHHPVAQTRYAGQRRQWTHTSQGPEVPGPKSVPNPANEPLVATGTQGSDIPRLDGPWACRGPSSVPPPDTHDPQTEITEKVRDYSVFSSDVVHSVGVCPSLSGPPVPTTPGLGSRPTSPPHPPVPDRVPPASFLCRAGSPFAPRQVHDRHLSVDPQTSVVGPGPPPATPDTAPETVGRTQGIYTYSSTTAGLTTSPSGGSFTSFRGRSGRDTSIFHSAKDGRRYLSSGDPLPCLHGGGVSVVGLPSGHRPEIEVSGARTAPRGWWRTDGDPAGHGWHVTESLLRLSPHDT